MGFIYFVRHGQTQKNKERVLQGRSDFMLNDTGVSQAQMVADRMSEQDISFGRVFASPLKRAVQTARIIAGEQTVIETDERLLEMDYGPYEGISLMTPPPEIVEFFEDVAHRPAPQGMEALSSVVERMGNFLEEIKKTAEQTDILIATHAIALKGALEYLTPGSDGSNWPKPIGNCAVYKVRVEKGTFSLPEEVLL